MAIKRLVDTSFWTDGKVDEFTPEDKYFMLYLLTNPFSTQLGIYEMASKLVCNGFEYPLSERESELLRDYVGKTITLGVRPENVIPDENGYLNASVTLNENLGQNTLVHGTVSGHKMTAKVRDWCNYKKDDQVSFSFDRVHFFDKETTNAIR